MSTTTPTPPTTTSPTMTTAPAGGASAPMTIRRGWPILLALTLATAVVTVDNTVLNVALPSIARSLKAGESQLQWIGNAYSLLFGGLLLTAGNLADRLGRKRVLLGGLVAFAASSGLVLAVHTPVELIALRALIGAAAAFVMPSTLALLFRVFAGPARMTAMTLWSSVSVLGFVGGPVLGGVILSHFSWHAVFLINIPIAVLALAVTLRWVPESADPTGERADLLGAALSVAMLGALVFGLVQGPVDGWLSASALAGFAGALGAGLAFTLWELRCSHPLLPVALLRRMSFAGPALAEAALMFAISGALFLLTQQLQLVDGYSPLQAALRVAPAALGSLLTGWLGVQVARRLGQNVCAATGFAICSVGLALCATSLAAPYWHLGAGLVVFGAGLRMAMTPVALAVIDALPAERAGMGSALNDSFQEVGGALGVAVLGSVLNAVFRQHLGSQLRGVGHSLTAAIGSGDPAVMSAARHAFLSGNRAAVLVGAVVMAAVAIVCAVSVPRSMADPDAAEVSS